MAYRHSLWQWQSARCIRTICQTMHQRTMQHQPLAHAAALLWLKAQRLWFGLFGPELWCGGALSSLCAFSQRMHPPHSHMGASKCLPHISPTCPTPAHLPHTCPPASHLAHLPHISPTCLTPAHLPHTCPPAPHLPTCPTPAHLPHTCPPAPHLPTCLTSRPPASHLPTCLLPPQLAAAPSLHLRHDQYHTYGSLLQDGADALDATFVMRRGCSLPASSCTAAEQQQQQQQQPITRKAGDMRPAAGGESGQGGGSGLQAWMRRLLGLQAAAREWLGAGAAAFGTAADTSSSTTSSTSSTTSTTSTTSSSEGDVVSLEALASPGLFLTVDPQGLLVLQQQQQQGGAGPCGSSSSSSRQLFRLVPGLSQQQGTASLESLALPGHYVSLAGEAGGEEGAGSCMDSGAGCAQQAAAGACQELPHAADVACRRSCGACGRGVGSATVLPAPAVGGTGGGNDDSASSRKFAVAASWRLVAGAGLLPPGSKVVCGSNRGYVIAPLGNIIEERYTAYFDFTGAPASPGKAT